jgi:hypothetical protein
MTTMTDKLRELIVKVETWPQEAQEELVRSAFDIEMRYVGRYELSEEDRAALAQSLDDVRNGRFATDDQVTEVFARFRHA